jgi:hypothetical protein
MRNISVLTYFTVIQYVLYCMLFMRTLIEQKIFKGNVEGKDNNHN